MEVEITKTQNGFLAGAEHGRMRISHLGHGVVIAEYEGIAYGDFLEPAQSFITNLRVDERIQLFVDAEGMRSYERAYRVGWTRWLQDNEATIESVHIFYVSRLVHVGIVVVNAVTGGSVTPHASRESFDRAVESARLAAKR